jgi:hypothetical protein
MSKIYIIFFVLFSITSHSSECNLVSVLNDNLIRNKAVESHNEYFKRIYPLIYQDEFELKKQYSKKINELELVDYTDYKNYVLFDRIQMLSFLTKANIYNQKCIEDIGVLKVKLKINIVSVDYNRFILHFRKINDNWLIYYTEATNTSYKSSVNFDKGLVYQVIKGI